MFCGRFLSVFVLLCVVVVNSSAQRPPLMSDRYYIEYTLVSTTYLDDYTWSVSTTGAMAKNSDSLYRKDNVTISLHYLRTPLILYSINRLCSMLPLINTMFFSFSLK